MSEQTSSLELCEEEPLTNPNFTMAFEALPLPPLDPSFALHFSDDLTFSEDALIADLDDFDFSLDDLLLPDDFLAENGSGFPFLVPDSGFPISPQDSANGSSGVDFRGSSNARVSNSEYAASSEGSPDSGQFLSVQNREIAGDSIGYNTERAYSADSCKVLAGSVEKRDSEGFETTKNENGSGGWLKRKKEREDAIANPTIKFHKLISSEADSSCVFSAGNCEEDKIKARLMRNRESAQLSRQRKKRYVQELEEKVRALQSSIAELNSKVSFVMSENATLRQHLGGVCGNPSLYTQAPMAPMHYPWVSVNPAVGFCSRSQVPLVPIPRLRPQETAPAVKPNKKASKVGETERNKHQSKTKKMASVTFLGLFLFLLVFGGLVNFRYPVGSSRLEFVSGGVEDKSRGKVFTIKEVSSRLSTSEGVPLPGNASEPLVASLYVPRNDQLEKIDGNLIIRSVLAGEKAMRSLQGRSEKGTVPFDEGVNNGLAIPSNMLPALAVNETGNNVEMHSHLYRRLNDHQRALASSSRDGCGDNSKSASVDGPLQQWFLEGLTGPVLSSSMCTEVFQFEVSSAIGLANVSADRSANDTAHSCRIRNRRILSPAAIPLNGTTLNRIDSRRHAGKPLENGELSGNKSVVVSVLVDPREAGDGIDGEVKVLPKALSRIFVVVLLDSVNLPENKQAHIYRAAKNCENLLEKAKTGSFS